MLGDINFRMHDPLYSGYVMRAYYIVIEGGVVRSCTNGTTLFVFLRLETKTTKNIHVQRNAHLRHLSGYLNRTQIMLAYRILSLITNFKINIRRTVIRLTKRRNTRKHVVSSLHNSGNIPFSISLAFTKWRKSAELGR